MKKLYILILLILPFLSFAQNYKITYAFSLNIDADTIKNIDRRNYFKNYFPEHAKNTFGVLWVNKDKAIFEQEGDLFNSSYKFNYLINNYTSSLEKKLFRENHEVLNSNFKYYYIEFSDYQWQITKDSKIINGYTCYKAIGSLQALNPKLPRFYFEAWFCPEIPLSFGPDKFSGLPGLIFEAYFIDGKDLHWKLKSIEKIDKKDFKFPDVSNSEPYLDSYKRMFDFFQSLKK